MLRNDKDIFVVSDLHMGDGGPRDNFAAIYKDNFSRPEQFEKFLDYVETCDGQLLIIGDLFELWQSNFGEVIINSLPLLDRLAKMNAVYVVGNHDIDLLPFVEHNIFNHPFFTRMSESFEHKIAEKRFKFMHGHEVDPFNNAKTPGIGRILTIVAGAFEDVTGSPYVESGETVENVLCETGEAIWNLIADKFKKTDKEAASKIPGQEPTPRQKPSRLKEHLEQIKKDKDAEQYDYAIVGHTHKPGKYEDWYFNSGSWVCMEEGRIINNFIRISIKGDVNVYNWENDKAILNNTVL